MRTIAILGAGMFGRACSDLLNRRELQLIAFGDNDAARQGIPVAGVPVLSVEKVCALEPELLFIGVADDERAGQLVDQARSCGFAGEFLLLKDYMELLDIRAGTLRRMAVRIAAAGIAGSVAELGVYKGDLAWRLNALFPERTLYLFDTFEGFDERDTRAEREMGLSRPQEGDFADTSAEAVLARLPYPDRAVVRKGYFPDTAEGLEDEVYALVSLDADLYQPILAGLDYFYPRLAPGGMILLHDYGSERFRGARQAVREYEACYGRLALVPLCDLHGTAVIVRP